MAQRKGCHLICLDEQKIRLLGAGHIKFSK